MSNQADSFLGGSLDGGFYCRKQDKGSSSAGTALPDQEEYLRRQSPSPDRKQRSTENNGQRGQSQQLTAAPPRPRAGARLPPKQRALTAQLLLFSELPHDCVSPAAAALEVSTYKVILPPLTIACWVSGEEEVVYHSSSQSSDQELQRHGTCRVCTHRDPI